MQFVVLPLGLSGGKRACGLVGVAGGGEDSVDAGELGVAKTAGEFGDADVEGAVVAVAGDFKLAVFGDEVLFAPCGVGFQAA